MAYSLLIRLSPHCSHNGYRQPKKNPSLIVIDGSHHRLSLRVVSSLPPGANLVRFILFSPSLSLSLFPHLPPSPIATNDNTQISRPTTFFLSVPISSASFSSLSPSLSHHLSVPTSTSFFTADSCVVDSHFIVLTASLPSSPSSTSGLSSVSPSLLPTSSRIPGLSRISLFSSMRPCPYPDPPLKPLASPASPFSLLVPASLPSLPPLPTPCSRAVSPPYPHRCRPPIPH